MHIWMRSNNGRNVIRLTLNRNESIILVTYGGYISHIAMKTRMISLHLLNLNVLKYTKRRGNFGMERYGSHICGPVERRNVGTDLFFNKNGSVGNAFGRTDAGYFR